MRKQDFENLLESVRQAGRIRRGEMVPSRVTEFRPLDVKAVRRRLKKSQSEFAHDRGERCHFAELGTGPAPPGGTGARPAAGRSCQPRCSGGSLGDLARTAVLGNQRVVPGDRIALIRLDIRERHRPITT